MLSLIKEKFSAPIDFLAKKLQKAGLSPCLISFIGLLMALLSSWFYYLSLENQVMRLLALMALLISGLFDALDGAVARLSSNVTKLGGILDSVMDRIGEISIISAIILGKLSSTPVGLLAIGSSVMVSYIRARSEVEGIIMKGVGIAERPERILILAAATLIGQIEIGLIVISILALMTIIQRLYYVINSARKKNISE